MTKTGLLISQYRYC